MAKSNAVYCSRNVQFRQRRGKPFCSYRTSRLDRQNCATPYAPYIYMRQRQNGEARVTPQNMYKELIGQKRSSNARRRGRGGEHSGCGVERGVGAGQA
jgi:hypothetical protein